MPNTNTDTAVELYSNKFIAGLTRSLAPLRAFSLDLSDDVKEPGETVSVPLVSADTVAAWNAVSNNYGRAAGSLLAKTVALNKRKICGFAVTSAQMQNFRPNYWEGKADLNQREMADSVLGDITGLVNAANYGAANQVAVALATFGRKAIAALRGKIVTGKLIAEKCALALNPDFFAALLADLDSQVYGGRDAIVGGVIPGLLGFRSVFEAPSYAGAGFVCHPDAIAVASRKIVAADTTPYREYGSMVEPETGLAMNRVWFTNGNDGQSNFSTECLFGCDVGNPNSLWRLEA